MTHPRRLLRSLTVCSVVTGMMLIASSQGTGAPLDAQLSGQGSSLTVTTGIQELHGAAEIAAAQSEAGVQLAMGALFILLAFFFHALMRHRDERNVHITVKPKSRTPKPTMIDKREWYWVHLHV